MKNKIALIFYLTQRTQRTQNSNANYATAEVAAGYSRQRAQRRTEAEDDKTISQKDDKHIKCALSALYLALSLAISLYLAKRKICAVYLHLRTDER